jgi:hypothetical protein
MTTNQSQTIKPIKELTLLFPVSSGTQHRTKTQTEVLENSSSSLITDNNKATTEQCENEKIEANLKNDSNYVVV